MPLTDKQIDFFSENGYLNIGRVLSDFDCDMVLRIYEEHADESYAPILNLDRIEPYLLKVVCEPKVIEAVEAIYGAVDALQTYFFFKRPGTPYAAQEWSYHQDNSYAQAEPFAYLAVEIALADQNPENGSMYFFPGTHKYGLLPFEPHTGFQEKPGTRPGNRCELPNNYVGQRVDLQLKKGEAFIFDGNLVHATYANRSQYARPAIITNYIRQGVDFISGRTAHRMRIPVR